MTQLCGDSIRRVPMDRSPIPAGVEEYGEYARRDKLRFEQGMAIARGCLARLDLARLAPEDLLSAAGLQVLAGEDAAAAATIARLASLPMSYEARLRLASGLMINGNAAVDLSHRFSRPLLPAIRALTTLADSAHASTHDRIAWRMLLANATRAIDSLQAYHVVDEIVQVARTSPSRTAMDLGPVSLLVDSMTAWSIQDGVPSRAVGFALQLGATLSDTSKPSFAASVQYDAASVIGTRAAPLEASHWVNMPAGTTRMALDDGKVTLIEFTNWGCGVCRKSYPVLNALYRELAGRGLRVVIATGIMGSFEGELMPPEREVVADSAYFSGRHAMPFPIVIGDSIMDVNARRMRIFGAPQFVLVDRRGVIRDSFYDWTPALVARLDASVRRVVAE